MRQDPEQWTAEVWADVYGFVPRKGEGWASRKDTNFEGKFRTEHDPKDGFYPVDCKHPRECRVIEFLLPYCPNVPLSGGHRVIDITNKHFIHAGPFKGTGVSIYLLLPILYPEKPKRLSITMANTIFGALSGARLVNWGDLFKNWWRNRSPTSARNPFLSLRTFSTSTNRMGASMRQRRML